MKASDYRKLASKKQVTEEVKLPSGAVWKMRVPPLQQWVAVGILPASLAAKMAMAANAGTEEKAAEAVVKTFTEKDFMDQQDLGRKMLVYSAVEPKVSFDVDEDTDAISPEDIITEDMEFIMRWLWTGGKAGEKLANFRPE